MPSTRYPSVLLIVFSVLVVCGRPAIAMGHDWLPQPQKAAIMVISAHPDDEGIFFGGAIPYYAQVRGLPMVHISMTSGDWHREPEIREEELRNADWIYGLRNEPLFPRFKDYPTSTLDGTWDVWADGLLDGAGIEEGRAAAGLYVAEQIRRYRPDVIICHDIEGEYGHNNHRATSLATIDAWTLAADPDTSMAGLDPYQASKIYVHQSEATGLGTPGYTFENWLFHDYWEAISIDTDNDGTADTSPRLVADVGLDEHLSQGAYDASTVYRTDETFNGHHSEWWGLYASTVGPDNLSSFMIEGYDYTQNDGWARGDFFQHVDLSQYYLPGDANTDGVVDNADATLLAVNWQTQAGATWEMGDFNADGAVDDIDATLLAANWQQTADGSASVPEPGEFTLLAVVLLWFIAVRRRMFEGNGYLSSNTRRLSQISSSAHWHG